jgi:hypothetical protein
MTNGVICVRKKGCVTITAFTTVHLSMVSIFVLLFPSIRDNTQKKKLNTLVVPIIPIFIGKLSVNAN